MSSTDGGDISSSDVATKHQGTSPRLDSQHIIIIIIMHDQTPPSTTNKANSPAIDGNTSPVSRHLLSNLLASSLIAGNDHRPHRGILQSQLLPLRAFRHQARRTSSGAQHPVQQQQHGADPLLNRSMILRADITEGSRQDKRHGNLHDILDDVLMILGEDDL